MKIRILYGIMILMAHLWVTSSCKSTAMQGEVASDATSDGKYPGFTLPQKDFLWGMATAPAHVEDDLDDIWLAFALDVTKPVKAWLRVPYAADRLRFWSDYKTEIDLLAKLHVNIYRLGVDWGRLVPQKPRNLCVAPQSPCFEGVLDKQALDHYKTIIRYARGKGLKIMLTLSHHSLPQWLQSETVDLDGNRNLGGWTNPDATLYFLPFVKDVVTALKDDVAYYDIFNEPAVFALFAYGVGNFPPAKGMSITSIIDLPFFKGHVVQAIDNMIAAHKGSYKIIKTINPSAMVGIAQSVAYYFGSSFIESSAIPFVKNQMIYRFIDETFDQLDFIGLNYYGKEVVKFGQSLSPDVLYSDSGRAIYPAGLYQVFHDFYQRYNIGRNRNIPYLMTENGIADANDYLRPAYIVEHLAVISQLIKEGIPIKGYIHWTLADNWEWADGYCPKFGLAAVDRSTPKLTRLPRPSFNLFARIVAGGQVTEQMRADAWNVAQSHFGDNQKFCRGADGVNSLDEPVDRKIIPFDFRFSPPVALTDSSRS